jgi:glycosyltransferase involved in cell wall biosynthesis
VNNPNRAKAHRVLYVTFQSTRPGQGARAHVHEIADGLRSLGWVVRLVEPNYGPGAIGVRRRISEFVRLSILALRQAHGCRACYIRGHVAMLPLAAMLRVLQLPYVFEVNGTYDDLLLAWPGVRRWAWCFRLATRLQLRWAAAVVAVSVPLADWARAEARHDRVHVIPNGANVALFRPDVPPAASLPGPYVLFFGALAPWQGIETMLTAVSDPVWPSRVKLLFVGNGADQEKVDGACEGGRVRRLDCVAYEEMPSIIAGSLAALSVQNNLLGSQNRHSPLKVYETLACGRPAVVSDFPGQAELVREGRCGLVVPAEDPRALAEAVAWLWGHPAEAAEMGDRGRRLVVARHSWSARARETAKVLEAAVRRDDPGAPGL